MNASPAKKTAQAKTPGKAIAPLLLTALKETNTGLFPSPSRDAAIESLARPGTKTLVTGQQVGIFVGPLLTFYKIITAISAAKQIERATGSEVVPVFWLQSEDHDVEEIAELGLLSAEGIFSKLHYPVEPGNRISLSEFVFDEKITAFKANLAQMLGVDASNEQFNLLAKYYAPGASYVSAFKNVVAELFADTKLIFFDPRNAAARELALPVYRLAYEKRREISSGLEAGAAELESGGEKVQVQLRKDSPLFFFHHGSPAGPRVRLQEEGNNFKFLGGSESVQRAELEQLLQGGAGRFSSSALLRPLMQEALLPNTAYVGGPAEMQYFKQLAPLYGIFGVNPPRLIPRRSFMLLEPKARRLLSQMSLSTDDIIASPQDFAQKMLLSHIPESIRPDAIEQRLRGDVLKSYDTLKTELENFSAGLGAVFDRGEEKILRSITGSLDKYRQQIAERERVALERAEKLAQLLAPGGVLQERSYSFVYFWCKYGPALKEKIQGAADAAFAGDNPDAGGFVDGNAGERNPDKRNADERSSEIIEL